MHYDFGPNWLWSGMFWFALFGVAIAAGLIAWGAWSLVTAIAGLFA